MTSLLVVDHDPADQDRYRAALALYGVQTLACVSGEEALTLLRPPGSGVDAALVLWELRGRPAGAELLTRLRRARPGMPLLVVSAALDLSRVAAARALGACDFIDKARVRERLGPALVHALGPPSQPRLLEALRARLVGDSTAFREMLQSVAAVIPNADEPVLIHGENGAGKELVARALHDLGAPEGSPWVAVSVANIASSLVESILFGHEAGSFTGADRRKHGLFEQCGNGTFFLDEIGELEPPLQTALLRVLQERRFRRVGGTEELTFAARLVCATNRNLLADVAAGRFRQDLYHRIAGWEVRVPPVRERGDDRWLLLDHYLKTHGRGRSLRLSPEAKELLADYPFPGNVRELAKIVWQATLRCRGSDILPFDLPVEVMDRRCLPSATSDLDGLQWPEALLEAPQKASAQAIERAFNRVYLPRKLRQAGGRKERAAELAGLDPKTFRAKWKDAGLDNAPDTQ